MIRLDTPYAPVAYLESGRTRDVSTQPVYHGGAIPVGPRYFRSGAMTSLGQRLKYAAASFQARGVNHPTRSSSQQNTHLITRALESSPNIKHTKNENVSWKARRKVSFRLGECTEPTVLPGYARITPPRIRSNPLTPTAAHGTSTTGWVKQDGLAPKSGLLSPHKNWSNKPTGLVSTRIPFVPGIKPLTRSTAPVVNYAAPVTYKPHAPIHTAARPQRTLPTTIPQPIRSLGENSTRPRRSIALYRPQYRSSCIKVGRPQKQSAGPALGPFRCGGEPSKRIQVHLEPGFTSDSTKRHPKCVTSGTLFPLARTLEPATTTTRPSIQTSTETSVCHAQSYLFSQPTTPKNDPASQSLGSGNAKPFGKLINVFSPASIAGRFTPSRIPVWIGNMQQSSKRKQLYPSKSSHSPDSFPRSSWIVAQDGERKCALTALAEHIERGRELRKPGVDQSSVKDNLPLSEPVIMNHDDSDIEMPDYDLSALDAIGTEVALALNIDTIGLDAENFFLDNHIPLVRSAEKVTSPIVDPKSPRSVDVNHLFTPAMKISKYLELSLQSKSGISADMEQVWDALEESLINRSKGDHHDPIPACLYTNKGSKIIKPEAQANSATRVTPQQNMTNINANIDLNNQLAVPAGPAPSTISHARSRRFTQLDDLVDNRDEDRRQLRLVARRRANNLVRGLVYRDPETPQAVVRVLPTIAIISNAPSPASARTADDLGPPGWVPWTESEISTVDMHLKQAEKFLKMRRKALTTVANQNASNKIQQPVKSQSPYGLLMRA